MRRDTPTGRASFDATAGWTALEGLLSDADVDRVRSICRELLLSPADGRRAGDKPAAGTLHLSELDDRSDFIAELLNLPLLVETVANILGPSVYRDQVSYRAPRPTYGGQFLHTDDPPKLDDGPDTVATAIIALTTFTERNGATRLVPGSHRRLDLQRQAGRLTHHPDEIVLTGSAGTAFVFSGHILHSGTQNNSFAERPALQLVWRTGTPTWEP